MIGGHWLRHFSITPETRVGVALRCATCMHPVPDPEGYRLWDQPSLPDLIEAAERHHRSHGHDPAPAGSDLHKTVRGNESAEA